MIGVKSENKSSEYFLQLDKKASNSIDVKAAHQKKKTKSLSFDPSKLNDPSAFKKLFEDILNGKVSEKKNIKKEEIKPLAKNSEKEKTKGVSNDNALAYLHPQTTVKSESVSAALKNIEQKEIESKDDKTAKEKSTFSKNILSQLFEKNSIEKNGSNSLSYYINQNNSIEKNINLKENNELKKEKEKKDFFKIVDLRVNSSKTNKNIQYLKLLSDKETSEVSQVNRFTFSNNNVNQNNLDMKELPQDSQIQLSTGKLQQPDSSLISSRTAIPSFHSQFLEYLRENGNANIVKNANVILKENNEGEIRLLMKPESLGYVRIKLMLNDTHIAGKIIVDNHNVKEIFENNLENLIRNFKESGYSSATIDVSVGGEQNNRQKQSIENDRVLALKEIEKIDEHTIVRTMLSEERLVDLVI